MTKTHGPRSLNHFLPGPLQKMFADPRDREVRRKLEDWAARRTLCSVFSYLLRSTPGRRIALPHFVLRGLLGALGYFLHFTDEATEATLPIGHRQYFPGHRWGKG